MAKPVGDVVWFAGKRLPIQEAWRVGGVIYVSGQLAFGPKGVIVGDDVVSQTHQVVSNIEKILQKAGRTLADVFKVTVWLRSCDDFAAFNMVYGEYFGTRPPARTVVRAELMLPQALVEIEVQAVAAD